jgi:stalled ribosome alternative rescue factor ArfA
MKSHKATPESKLVKRFDNELKALLTSELKRIKKAKKQMVSTLSAA